MSDDELLKNDPDLADMFDDGLDDDDEEDFDEVTSTTSSRSGGGFVRGTRGRNSSKQ